MSDLPPTRAVPVVRPPSVPVVAGDQALPPEPVVPGQPVPPVASEPTVILPAVPPPPGDPLLPEPEAGGPWWQHWWSYLAIAVAAALVALGIVLAARHNGSTTLNTDSTVPTTLPAPVVTIPLPTTSIAAPAPATTAVPTTAVTAPPATVAPAPTAPPVTPPPAPATVPPPATTAPPPPATAAPSPPTTPAPPPAPTTAPTTAPAKAPATTFGPGVHKVGTEVAAGRYLTTAAPGTTCTWRRLDASNRVLAQATVTGQVVLDLLPTDGAVDSGTGCGTWAAPPPAPAPVAQPGDGDWLVGNQLAAGTWQAAGGATCTWQRVSAFTGDPTATLASGGGATAQTVTVAATDAGFEAQGCGQWTRTG